MILLEKDVTKGPKIMVVGVGGAGSNAVDCISEEGLDGVSFVILNTDTQALALAHTEPKIAIGQGLTGGRGTGGDPNIGEQAAKMDSEVIQKSLEDAEMVFIVAGLGGGTGTGAAPIVADIAKDLGALTVGITTKPFNFEGSKRLRKALCGQDELRSKVDTLITIPNQRLTKIVSENTTILEAFKAANGVVLQCVQSISDIITQPGIINRDFADIKGIMKEMGGAVMGIGFGKGENRAVEAFQQATTSSLLEEMVIEGARGILVNITCGPDLRLLELSAAMEEYVVSRADKDANIVFGMVLNNNMQDELKVTILANRIHDREEIPEPDFTSVLPGEEFVMAPQSKAVFPPNFVKAGKHKEYVGEIHESFSFTDPEGF